MTDADHTSFRDDSLHVVADLAQLATVGRFIRDRCGSHPRVALIELAVHEVVLNATQHGVAQHCRISIRPLGGGFEVVIADDGTPFDVPQATALPPGELRERGFGIGIVHRVADRLSYTYRDGWNTLTLTFAL